MKKILMKKILMKKIFWFIFITWLVLGLTNLIQAQENPVPDNYSKQEGASFVVYYDGNIFSKQEIKTGLKFLEKVLKEECARTKYCQKPDYKIPVVYHNEFGPKRGSANVRGIIISVDNCRGYLLYNMATRDYASIEDILRHELNHIIVPIGVHWASEGYACLSENSTKFADRLRYGYAALKKLPDEKIFKKLITEFDFSGYNDFLEIMGDDQTRAEYGINTSLADWLIIKLGSRDKFIEFIKELKVDKTKSESWKKYAPNAYEELEKNNGFFVRNILTNLREEYFLNYLSPKFFGKKYTFEELEKEWRDWVKRKVGC